MEIDKLFELSPNERIALAQDLWDSVSEKDIELSNSIKKELDKRLAAHKNGKMVYYTREEIRHKLSEN